MSDWKTIKNEDDSITEYRSLPIIPRHHDGLLQERDHYRKQWADGQNEIARLRADKDALRKRVGELELILENHRLRGCDLRAAIIAAEGK